MTEEKIFKSEMAQSGHDSKDQTDNLLKFFNECRLCPRECGIDRTGVSVKSRSGFCRQDYRLRVAHVGAHFGEEPPISGIKGSGTIFFSGCSLRCSFCQNFQISIEGSGDVHPIEELYEMVVGLIRRQNVHNVNLVTPDHFFPYTFRLVEMLRKGGFSLPILYNTSGYQSQAMLRQAEEYADIYLPDYKYSDPDLAKALSKCSDYPTRAMDAISEMVRQKGFLDSFEKGTEIATRGVLVRHLILPGKVKNSLDSLTALFLEFGSGIPISLMSQYHPVAHSKAPDMNRRIMRDEFDRVYQYSLDLGFKNMFVQFPVDYSHDAPPFLPNFEEEEPFQGNDSGKRR